MQKQQTRARRRTRKKKQIGAAIAAASCEGVRDSSRLPVEAAGLADEEDAEVERIEVEETVGLEELIALDEEEDAAEPTAAAPSRTEESADSSQRD